MKSSLRASLPPEKLDAASYGRLAEKVRRLPGYRQCRRIFVSPVPSLRQARINALLDQKELVTASAALKRGFVRFRPNTIPFKQLGHAVSFKGLDSFGERLHTAALAEMGITLGVVAAQAVDPWGGMLGDGLGLTDLALGILAECGGLMPEAMVYALVAENRLLEERLPKDPWDVTLSGVITLGDFAFKGGGGPVSKGVDWSALPKKRIRKIQPLWDLWRGTEEQNLRR